MTTDPMPECACGNPAETQIYAGHHNRGGKWVRTYTWMCQPCAIEDERETRWGRAQ